MTGLIVLSIISYLSAYLFSKYIVKGKGSFYKLISINIFLMAFMFFYRFHLVPAFLESILIRLAIMWFVFLGVMIIILLLYLLVIKFILREKNTEAKDKTRRKFLKKLVILPAATTALYGGLFEADHIEFTTVDVKNAPKILEDVVIAQISDVHLGLFFSVERLKNLILTCQSKGANILALTGDIFDDDNLNVKAIEMINSLTPLFPYGVYYCYGNHEHYRDFKKIKETLDKTNITVLENSSTPLFMGKEAVYILGVDYVESREEINPIRDEYISKAMKNVPQDSYKILLAHHPNCIDDGFRNNINLTMAGHTHGGQVRLFGESILPIFKYMAGEVSDGNMLGYVSRGAGSWFPFRFMCSCEVVFYRFLGA